MELNSLGRPMGRGLYMPIGVTGEGITKTLECICCIQQLFYDIIDAVPMHSYSTGLYDDSYDIATLYDWHLGSPGHFTEITEVGLRGLIIQRPCERIPGIYIYSPTAKYQA